MDVTSCKLLSALRLSNIYALALLHASFHSKFLLGIMKQEIFTLSIFYVLFMLSVFDLDWDITYLCNKMP